MVLHEIQTLKNSPEVAADFIAHLNHHASPTDHEQWMLATAHCTLARQKETSFHKTKLHVNSAITFLQNIKIRNPDWGGTLAQVYFNRAELFEQESAFVSATKDYQRALRVLEEQNSNRTLTNQDKLLLARSAISIADLFLNSELDGDELKINHPLYYATKALEYLAQISNYDNEAWITFACAHQIAGVTLTSTNFEEAKMAFQNALEMAFRTDQKHACRIISEVYHSQGVLYEQAYWNNPIKIAHPHLLDYASFYFGLWLLFAPRVAYEGNQPELIALDSFFDLFYAVLDPYSSVLTPQMQRDFIDAMIFAYSCVVNKTLPNQFLGEELIQQDNLYTFAQHIHWVLSENYLRVNKEGRLLDAVVLDEVERTIDYTHLLDKIEKGQKRIFEFNPQLKAKKKQKEAAFV